MSNSFLVQLDDTPTFLTALRSGKPYGTSYPTQAISMSFDAAGELCNRFREQGYAAVVVDRFGQPPTAIDLMSVKRSVEYLVLFSGYFFTGVNPSGREEGSRDRNLAKCMPQELAVEVMKKLRRAGHTDAAVVEASSPVVDVEEELQKIWPNSEVKQ